VEFKLNESAATNDDWTTRTPVFITVYTDRPIHSYSNVYIEFLSYCGSIRTTIRVARWTEKTPIWLLSAAVSALKIWFWLLATFCRATFWNAGDNMSTSTWTGGTSFHGNLVKSRVFYTLTYIQCLCARTETVDCSVLLRRVLHYNEKSESNLEEAASHVTSRRPHFPRNLPLPVGIWTPYNIPFPPDPPSQKAVWSPQLFCTLHGRYSLPADRQTDRQTNKANTELDPYQQAAHAISYRATRPNDIVEQ